MRIFQLHCRYRVAGGEDTVVEAEREALGAAGHEVAGLTTRNRDDLRAAGQLVTAVWNPAAARRVAAAVNAFRPDVVHVHNTWFGFGVAPVVRVSKAGTPVVMTLHNYRLTCANGLLLRDEKPCFLCVDGSALNGALHNCYRDPISSAIAASNVALHRRLGSWVDNVERFISLTSFARSVFTRAGVPAAMIDIVPNWVEDPGRRSRPPSASNTVLYVGRLSPSKGVETLLSAWREARPDGLQLKLVGEGPLLGPNDSEAGIQFVGRMDRSDVIEEMLRARALCIPSQWFEGQPMVALEAMTAGLPVLASRLGGLEETLSPLGEEWLVTPSTVEEWKRALARLNNGPKLDEYSAIARRRAQSIHSQTAAVSALERVYRSAIESRV